VVVDERRRQELSLPRAGDYVRMAVIDSGSGMAPEIRSRVFEPFFTTKGPGQGTGLGLATVHGLVAQHRGAVRLESEVGRGTRVEVYLPVAPPTAEGVAPRRTLAVPGGTESILVAEDDPLVLELTRAYLASAGYTVFTARSGVEALGVIDDRATEIDLAVLDVVMPKLGGEAVLGYLRERRPGVPVVFASGYGRRSRSVESPPERIAFLQKPFGREEGGDPRRSSRQRAAEAEKVRVGMTLWG